MSSRSNSLFRIDKFEVPARSRAAFMDKLNEAKGCLQNHILEQVSGTGRFNILTLVEWSDGDAYKRARAASEARHKTAGFDPETMFRELEITADLGNYSIVGIDSEQAHSS
jgi:heme-degrading monooxygenase HmoA